MRKGFLLALCALPAVVLADLWVRLPPGTPHQWMLGLPAYGVGEAPKGDGLEAYGWKRSEEARTGGRPEAHAMRRAGLTTIEGFMGDVDVHRPDVIAGLDPKRRLAAPPFDDAFLNLCCTVLLASEIEPPARMDPVQAVNFLVSLDSLVYPTCLGCWEQRKKGPAERLSGQVLERITGLAPDPRRPGVYQAWWEKHAGASPPDPRPVKSFDESVRWIVLKELSEGRYRQKAPFGWFIRENPARTLPELSRIASDASLEPQVRRNAVGFLGEIVSPEARQALRDLTGSKDAVVRTRALSELILQEDRESLPLFRKAAEGSDPFDAALGIEALGLWKDADSLDFLLRQWKGGKGELSVSALAALVRIGDPKAKPLFERVREDASPMVPLARAGLIRLGEAKFIKTVGDDVVYGDPDWAPLDTVWCGYQLEAMAASEAGRERLWEQTRGCSKGSPIMRAYLLGALPDKPGGAWPQRLAKLVAKGEIPVCTVALSRLGEMDPGAARSAAEKVVQEDGLRLADGDADARAFLIVAMQSLKGLDPKTAGALRRISESKVPTRIVVEALRTLGQDASFETAKRMRDLVLGQPSAFMHRNPAEAGPIRLRAAVDLGLRGGRASAEALAGMLDDLDPVLRVQAALSLERMTGRGAFADLLSTPRKDWRAFQAGWRAWIDQAKMAP